METENTQILEVSDEGLSIKKMKNTEGASGNVLKTILESGPECSSASERHLMGLNEEEIFKILSTTVKKNY